MRQGIAATAALLLLLAGAAQAQTTSGQGSQGASSTGQGSQGAASSTGAASQSSQGAKSPGATGEASGVTVQGKRPDYRSSIDRKSYSLTNDVQAANGSLADALRNVPSLDVDPQGNLSIRGDQSVTILIDGQPAPALNGPNRGDLLQTLPANQYERVEVMTNPSAALRPEGTGGIVNLITKKNHGALRTASISAAASTNPRDRITASGTLGEQKLTLSGVAFATRQANIQDSRTAMHLIDPASGEAASINSTQHVRQFITGGMLFGDAAYTPDANTRLDANLRYIRYAAPDDYDGAYRSSATAGVLARDYDYVGRGKADFSVLSSQTTYTRQLGGQDHQVELHASYNDQSFTSDDRQLITYELPQQPDLFQDLAQTQQQRSLDLKAEYKGPMPGKAKLVAGYELQMDDDAYGHGGALGDSPATAAPDPSLTDRFDFTQWVSDLYATYQRPIGRFDVMPGLRLEQVTIHTDQLTRAITGGQSYFEAYPTLHVSYALDDSRQLTASYSRRVDRPGGQELDPFRVYNSPVSFTEGNPRLAPTITNSWELGYEYTKGQTFLTASLYYKDAGNVVESTVENLGGGVTLNTFDNIGHTRNAGVELTAGGHVTKTLSFSASGDLAWNQIATADNGVLSPKAAADMFGHLNLKWSPTANDFVQLSLWAHGRQITGQGAQASWENLGIGYRHRFNGRLAVELVANDPFGMDHWRTIIETPTLSEVTNNNFHSRSLQIGLTYEFGTVRKQAPAKEFEFGGGGGAGGGAAPQ
ncbi:MAG TPA: TonB-dependent receptor [Caulobacteraceae bacterium]